MKNLKFRAWDGEEMRYLDAIVGDGFELGFCQNEIGFVDNSCYPTDIIYSQFTGLKDKKK